MLSHKRIWNAIDKIAKTSGLTPSGLAKKAGLDPTSFNKSKRTGASGKLRWPSTESLYKVLKALGKDLSYFSSLVEPDSVSEIQVIGSIQHGNNGFHEADENNELENINMPRSFNSSMVAIKIKDNSLEPVYRNGETLLVNTKEHFIVEDDKVIVRTNDNKLLLGILCENGEENVVIKDIMNGKKISTLASDIDLIAKIMWVSQ